MSFLTVLSDEIQHILRKIISARFLAVLAALYLWIKLAEAGDIPVEFTAGQIGFILGYYFKREMDVEGEGRQ